MSASDSSIKRQQKAQITQQQQEQHPLVGVGAKFLVLTVVVFIGVKGDAYNSDNRHTRT